MQPHLRRSFLIFTPSRSASISGTTSFLSSWFLLSFLCPPPPVSLVALERHGDAYSGLPPDHSMPVRGMLVVQGQIGTCLSSLSSRLECLMPPSINPSPTHMLHTFYLTTHAHAPHLPHLNTCFTPSPTESARGGTQTERERLNNTHTCTYTHTHSLTHSLTHSHTHRVEYRCCKRSWRSWR